MSFKDTFRLRIDRLAGQVGPLLEESWREARQRLDDLNQALASQAVPGERRARVSELALKRKGQQAGQKSAEIRPFPEQGKAGDKTFEQ